MKNMFQIESWIMGKKSNTGNQEIVKEATTGRPKCFCIFCLQGYREERFPDKDWQFFIYNRKK